MRARSFFHLASLISVDHDDAMVATDEDLGAVLRGEDGQNHPVG